MDNWLEVSIKVLPVAAEAVADVFTSLRSGGVVVEDPELINSFRISGDWDFCDIPEAKETAVTITAYFADDDELQAKLQKAEAELALIEARIGKYRFGQLLFRKVNEQDWANEWKQYFHTVKVGEKLVIKPTWEEYAPQGDERVIAIDPGMAFGTGTHHTTNMCMRFLEKLVRPDIEVFDVGTGSGILSIAAALLGAGQITAVDIDATAVKVAKENIAINRLSDKITLKQGDLLHGTDGKADLIIANIIADVILLLLPDVAVKLKPGGYFLASGIIESRLDDITAAAVQNGFVINEICRRDLWVAVLMSREA